MLDKFELQSGMKNQSTELFYVVASIVLVFLFIMFIAFLLTFCFQVIATQILCRQRCERCEGCEVSIMEFFIFHRNEYEYYYNCSKYTSEEWTAFGEKQTTIGAYSLVLSLVAFLLYVPCMKVMREKKLWQLNCYKLMFLNGIVDLIGVVGSFISGFLSLKGVVFCSYPTFLYITGTVVVSQYATQQVVAVLLAINRCLEFWQKPALTGLFEGKRIYLWWMIPTVHFLCMLFYTVACPFNSIVNMWMFDPYIGIPGIEADNSLYKDVPLLNYTNLFAFLTLNGSYIFLIGSVMYKTSQGSKVFLNKVQKQITIQALLICLTITVCSSIYVCFEYFPTFLNPAFLTVDFLLWQWGCCGAVLIYMAMNRTLRQGVIHFYLRLCRYDPAVASTSSNPYVASISAAMPRTA
ncbi:hypothetical protein QR680_016423 [Steinernema hermaphroditum]|uniref:Serpentine receptor class gamma n=1 Tax=Steinernema hermaphroditum TaxID=289476 RepID=A0AA39HD58_9BILA|nr:hypothetical protein QR680_016423 [Steinernema hermaphroditum]